ncbi:PREDICTED: CMT1A duplicated region transcript 4 protein [Phaethon lepturus]|uniref:CMT1A duplicated region transcript 4 protein n=1 Tax=Phaethon lepturus TaxID=97097 RepID=UPI0005306949|nr:PREDICTED: CMT1A duplicated region transcript 4 protein [Phaethon lepturus]
MREYALPSATLGLPGHLIQCHRPQPAYTTYTAPVVKMLVEQDEWRKAASNRPAEPEPNREPQEAGFEEETQMLAKLSRDFLQRSRLRQQGRFGPQSL